MIPFIQKTLFKNKTLWAWPGLFLLFITSVFIWGDITAAENSHSFFVHFGDLQIPAGKVLMQLLSLTGLIFIIGMPSHFAENLKPERASLLLSKPVSRSELFFSDFAGMLSVSFCYSFISVLLLGVLTLFKAGIFPIQFLAIALLFVPLFLLTYYITIVLFLILTDSYLGGVILGYFMTGLSSVFLDPDKLLVMLGWDGPFAETTVDIVSYLIPSSAGFKQVMVELFQGGMTEFNGEIFLFALATCLPFGLLSYYQYKIKEF